MTTQLTTERGTIEQRIRTWVEAIHALDLDGVMSIYAANIVSFDIVPPLRHLGAAAKRKAWEEVFAAYNSPLGYEIRDLSITLDHDVAFGHSLNRITGTLKNGQKTDFWLRWTTCFQKTNGDWLLVHEQLSVPSDLENEKALLNLEP